MGTSFQLTCYFLILLVLHTAYSQSVWTHVCLNNKFCERIHISELPDGAIGKPMEICKLNCNPNQGSLFPLPTGQVTLGSNLTPFYTGNVLVTGYEVYPVPVRNLFQTAAGVFTSYLEQMRPSANETNPGFFNNLVVTVRASDVVTSVLALDTDESYNLTLSLSPDRTTVTASISAQTFFGARHGLETLSQLIAYDPINDVLQIVDTANISDKPIYRYRGVHLDTSRNFISISNLKKLIDGLSYNKMNMFHWHITDSHSFPMQVANRPEFTDYGAYSNEKIYSLLEMSDLVEYARARGIKIIPEFEGPAHAGFGWQWGAARGLGNLTVCLNKQPWYDFCLQPPCGQLNIVNDNVYDMLGIIYASMLSIFDQDLFHMGGEEVNLACYNSTIEITEWMNANGVNRDFPGFMFMLGMYQRRAYEQLQAASSIQTMSGILWTSELTHREYREQYLNPQDYILQIWDRTNDTNIPDIINSGYRVIFSNSDALYLDCGFHQHTGTGLNWCSPYNIWQGIYDHNPHEIYANATNSTFADEALADGRLLGGETPLWTEMSDEHSFQSRIWPRAAALGERLWTNPTTGWADGEFRMVTNRARMVFRGIAADRIQPEFCSLYQNNCYGLGSWDGQL